jgi:hypothetical protein
VAAWRGRSRIGDEREEEDQGRTGRVEGGEGGPTCWQALSEEGDVQTGLATE